MVVTSEDRALPVWAIVANVSRMLGKRDGHLWLRHQMSSAQYHSLYSGARLLTFAQSVTHRGAEVRDFVAKTVAAFATPQQLSKIRLNPQWETDNSIESFVVCRNCGRKIVHINRGHLRTHGSNPEQYALNWPGAPRLAKGLLKARYERNLRLIRIGRVSEKNLQTTKPPKKRRGRTIDENRINLASAFFKLKWSQKEMSRFVFKDTPRGCYGNTRTLFSRHRGDIKNQAEGMSLADAKKMMQVAGAVT